MTKLWLFWVNLYRGCGFISWTGCCRDCGSEFYSHIWFGPFLSGCYFAYKRRTNSEKSEDSDIQYLGMLQLSILKNHIMRSSWAFSIFIVISILWWESGYKKTVKTLDRMQWISIVIITTKTRTINSSHKMPQNQEPQLPKSLQKNKFYKLLGSALETYVAYSLR